MADDASVNERAASIETVVVLHGLGRTNYSMQPLADRLAEANFQVHNLRYPSMNSTPEELVENLDGQLRACCPNAAPLHFVTHSLGGILVRAYLAERRPDSLGRVVMLAPPNRGSELVDLLGDTSLFRWIMGPTAVELGTRKDSFPNRLPPPDFELGVIAGTGSVNPLGSRLVPGNNDGTVSVESTQLPGMKDFAQVSESHTFIMRSPEVAKLVIGFLRNGQFPLLVQDVAGPEAPRSPKPPEVP